VVALRGELQRRATQSVPVVRLVEGERQGVMMRWGRFAALYSKINSVR
jgi:hypothetical protein